MRLGDVLGVPVVGQNMTGLAGAVGAQHVMDSTPDGYTVLFFQSSMFTNRGAGVSEIQIDDFELVAVAAEVAFSIFVQGASPFYTLQDLINASVAAPDTLMIAQNLGATSHYYAVLLNEAGARLRLVDVGDAAQRVTSLLGGHIHAIPSAFGPLAPHIQAGTIRPLATMNTTRNIVFSDVPTTPELGFPDAVFPMYYFFAFPKGTPGEIVEKFADAVEQVSRSDAYREGILESFQQAPFFMRGPQALNLLREQQAMIYARRDVLRE
jgi:tripartite-type tricarboxylate transporter receptor subunit TctC